jgi:hypothetical protein
MKEQQSEALLLFHALTCKKCQEPLDNSWQIEFDPY